MESMTKLRSMTGRGTGSAEHAAGRVDVELSSVNRKQLDVNVTLPKELSFLEADVLQAIQGQLSRGRVSGEMHWTGCPGKGRRRLRVDLPTAKAVVAALRQAANELGLADDLGASLLMEWPEVLFFDSDAEERMAIKTLAMRALQAALRSLLDMRCKEGAALGADLRKRLTTLKQLGQEIGARAPQVAKAYREHLLARIAEVLPNADTRMEDERLLKEIALFADRSDITEERVRLASHARQFGALLKEGGAVGRKLDFLVQEMGREINTIGAKANDGEIARRVIDFKAELERIREQVQNLE